MRETSGASSNPLRRDRLIRVAVSGVVDGCRLCLLPPKVHDGTPDSAVPDLLCDVSKQQVARLRQRAIQMQQLGGVSILLLFQVP